MAPLFTYSDPLGIDEPAVTVAVASNIRWGQVGVQMSAEIGQPAVSTIEIDDPDAVWDFVGLRAFAFRETSAPSNNQVVGQFVIEDRLVQRGTSTRTAAGRKWTLDLTDYNWHLGNRVFVDSDAKRPAETPGDRIRWLLNNAAHINLNDYGHVTYPSSPVLDANDFRGQRPTDLLADCAVEGGYMFWVDLNEAHGRPELFFMAPDSSAYAADLWISNDLADVTDYLDVYPPYEDAVLRRSPSRITFGVLVAHAKGYVYASNATTGQQFGKLDQTSPMANVKTATRARRIANKYLSDNDTEDDRITCSIKVPRANVNDVRQGQLMTVKFTHLPGYEDWTALRVIRKTVMQEEEGGDGYYKLVLDLGMGRTAATPQLPSQEPYTGSAFAALLRAGGDFGEPYGAWYTDTGDTPPGGWYAEPMVGSMWTLNSDANGYISITTSVPMRVRVEMYIGFSTVIDTGTASLTVHAGGTDVTDSASASFGGPHFWTDHLSVDFEADLAAGESVSFETSVSGFNTGGWGAGDLSTNQAALRVGRGHQVWNSGGVDWYGP